MIPKIIHYCWFGGKPLPELAQKCIASWRKYCPDYEIKEWNENNFDLGCCAYVQEAYQAKKWAFVSDYVRLYAMVETGGIYMDTDEEVIKPLDGFLQNRAFSGFEDDIHIPTGIMACEKGFALFEELLHDYDHRHFVKEDGLYDLTTNVVTITELCKKHGFIANNTKQNICGFTLYPKDVFCPKSHETGEITLTDNTVTIHHFSESWWSAESKISEGIKCRTKNKGAFIRVCGKIVAFPFTYTARAKTQGQRAALRYYLNKLTLRRKKKP